MEATTAPASATATGTQQRGTGSKSIADMLPLAAERYGERTAVRLKRDGEWHDVGYAEVAEIASEVARGLIDLGIEPGDRVCILCSTRPEWTYADFGITMTGAVVVPIFQGRIDKTLFLSNLQHLTGTRQTAKV